MRPTGAWAVRSRPTRTLRAPDREKVLPTGASPFGGGNEVSIQRVEPAAAHALVVEQLRRAVHIGSYVPGDRLPSERALAEQLGVSRATVREAIKVLRDEGYVESRRGARGGLMVLDQGLNEERMRPVVRSRLREWE